MKLKSKLQFLTTFLYLLHRSISFEFASIIV